MKSTNHKTYCDKEGAMLVEYRRMTGLARASSIIALVMAIVTIGLGRVHTMLNLC